MFSPSATQPRSSSIFRLLNPSDDADNPLHSDRSDAGSTPGPAEAGYPLRSADWTRSEGFHPHNSHWIDEQSTQSEAAFPERPSNYYTSPTYTDRNSRYDSPTVPPGRFSELTSMSIAVNPLFTLPIRTTLALRLSHGDPAGLLEQSRRGADGQDAADLAIHNPMPSVGGRTRGRQTSQKRGVSDVQEPEQAPSKRSANGNRGIPDTGCHPLRFENAPAEQFSQTPMLVDAPARKEARGIQGVS
jgi:hypothetical protein